MLEKPLVNGLLITVTRYLVVFYCKPYLMSRGRANSCLDLHSLPNTSELSDVLHVRCVKMTAFDPKS